MKAIKYITLPFVAVFTLVAAGAIADEVVSLRGEQGLAADSNEFARKDELHVSGGFDRSWKLQPPAIPHKTDNDRITLQENTCMSCHSPETYKEEKAPKVADSHFIDANGEVQTDLNMRRYFCSQCHVPQMDVNPLVENEFSGNK